MKHLTGLQVAYLQKVCMLLSLQGLLLVVVVWAMHRFFPDTVCFLTCGRWADLVLFLLVAVALVAASHRAQNAVVRRVSFFAISVLLAYTLSLQYNILSRLSGRDREVADRFFRSLVVVVAILVANLLLLPFTLGYLGVVSAVSAALTVCLVGLILWGLLVRGGFLAWVSVSLVVFLGLLLTDLTLLVSRCRTRGSVGCDPWEGASLLYVDLVNILQQIFLLLHADRF